QRSCRLGILQVTRRNAVGSNHNCRDGLSSRPSANRSGRTGDPSFPVFKSPAGTVGENGNPVRSDTIPFVCHPFNSTPGTPFKLLPDGNSYTKWITALCVMSNAVRPRELARSLACHPGLSLPPSSPSPLALL